MENKKTEKPIEIKDLFNKYDLIRVDKFNKINFEFQQLCLENEKLFGRAIWTLPFQKGVTDEVLREAVKICEKNGVTTFPYLKGVIKRILKQ